MISKKKIFYIFKFIISFSLIAYLVDKIDWQEAFQTYERAELIYFVVIILNYALQIIFTAYKWFILIRINHSHVNFGRILTINLIGSFLGLFFPSGLSMDVIRGYYISKDVNDTTSGVSSIVVDRLLSFSSLLLLGLAGVIMGGSVVAQTDIKIILYIILLLFIITIYFLNKEYFWRIIHRAFHSLKLKKAAKSILQLRDSLFFYKKYPRILVLSFIFSITIQILRVLIYYYLSLAFGIDVPISYFFILIPIVMILLMIPISIGGIGVREGTFVALFALVGLSTSDAFILAFTSTFFVTTISMIGGILYVLYKPILKKN